MSNRTPATPAFAIDAYYREVGKNIATARLATGLTQADLGQAMNLSRGSIAKIETGAQRHLAHTLTQIAVILGVKSDTLLPVEYRNGSPIQAQPESPVTKAELTEVNNLIEAARTKLKRISRKKRPQDHSAGRK